MRIIQLCHEYPPVGGGASRIVWYLSEELAKEHEVHVITGATPKAPRKEIRGGVTIHRVGFAWPINLEYDGTALKTYSSLVAYCAGAVLKTISLRLKGRFDLIHSHFLVPTGVAGVAASWLTGIPHIATAVEGDVRDMATSCMEPYKNPLIRAAIRFVVKRAQGLSSISYATREETLIPYEVKREDFDVVHYGIVKPRFTPAPREAVGLKPGNFYIAFAGRLVPRKGMMHLIEAISLIKDPRVCAVIIGDGPMFETLKELAAKLGVTDRIVFPGFVVEERKFQIVNNCDAFTLTSIHDGYSLVILEAMNCGKPIISTDFGGHAELVEPGVNGFLIPGGNPQALAEKIRALAEDEALCRKMGEASARKARDYTPETTAKAYEPIYARLVGGRG